MVQKILPKHLGAEVCHMDRCHDFLSELLCIMVKGFKSKIKGTSET